MNENLPGYVRTIVPMLVAAICSRYFPGIDPTDPTVLAIAFAISGIAFYAVARQLEKIDPRFGYLLGIAKVPAYSPAPSPSPDADEHLEVILVPDEKDLDARE